MQNKDMIDNLRKRITQLKEELHANEQALALLLPFYHDTDRALDDYLLPNEAYSRILNSNELSEANDYIPKYVVVENFIRSNNRFVHIKEIAHYLNVYFAYEDIDIATKKARNALDTLKANNTIIRYSVDNRFEFSFWGLPEWLNSRGTIIRGHEYTMDHLTL